MGIEVTGRAGITRISRGSSNNPFSQGYYAEALVSDLMPRYAQSALEGLLFTLNLDAISTGVAAGNIKGASAAASTQFGVVNPPNSGKNMILTKFGLGVVSGTPGAGPVFHGFITNITSLTAGTPGGTIRSNILGGVGASAMTPWALAAGSALTGSTQTPITFRVANFTSTATAAASVSEVPAIEEIAGDIIVPPGVMWLPLWSAGGSSLLCGYSVSWLECPV